MSAKGGGTGTVAGMDAYVNPVHSPERAGLVSVGEITDETDRDGSYEIVAVLRDGTRFYAIHQHCPAWDDDQPFIGATRGDLTLVAAVEDLEALVPGWFDGRHDDLLSAAHALLEGHRP